MPKFSAIAPAGVAPAVTDQVLFVTGGTTDNLVTVTQLAAGLPVFTSTARGSVPASGGVATTFLNGAGGFTTPAGTSPGGSTLQIQYNNAGAFGGANVWRTGANQLDLSNGATAQQLRVYNTTDNNGGAPTNSEWGGIDWISNPGVLQIGFQKTGAGNNRACNFVGAFNGGAQTNMTTGAFNWNWNDGNAPRILWAYGQNGNLQVGSGLILGFNAAIDVSGALDTGFNRAAAKVIQCNDGAGLNANGWIQTQGMQRVGSDVGYTSSVVLTTLMTVNVQAGRTYSFDVYLSVTGSAGGVQAAIGGTATTTDVRYDGYVIDNAAAGTKGAAQAAALGAAVANPATITGPASAVIRGTVTVNAAGTLTVQAAQATSSGTTTTIKRGSYAWFCDMP